VPVCICGECGRRVTTRSQFEVDCPECGAEEALVPEDAYEPEPSELVCVDCGFRVESGGRRRASDDDFYEGRFSVDDSCPRCEGVLDPDGGRRKTAREQPEFKLAKAAARTLVAKHKLSGPKIDVEALALAEGLEVVRGRFDHQGKLEGATIQVPENESEAAQRFLIAHELGHWHLRHQYQIADDKIEPEANAFAAELVISTSELREAVKGGLTLRELCGRFGASREAIVYALMSARLMNQVRPS